MSIHVKQSLNTIKISDMIACGSLTLTYKSSTILRGTVTIGTQYVGMSVIASVLAVSGTPYLQTQNIITQNVNNTGSVVIEALGAGYVSGHVLEVTYLVLPRTV